MNWELPEVQVGFRDGRWIRVQVANIHWIKAREFQKNTNIPEKHQTHESCLDKEIKPINLKENQPWKFIGRTIARLESFVDKNLCFVNYAKAFDCVDHNKLWTALKEMGIPDHLTCLLRSLYVGQEATVSTLYGKTDWFKIEKDVWKDYLLSPCLFNLYKAHIIRNAELDELQAGIEIGRRNIKNLRYADDTTLMAERKEKLKSLSMKVKEEGEKVSLKLNIKKKKELRSWHPLPSLPGKKKGKRWKQWQMSSYWALKSLWMVTAGMKLEDDCL